MVRHHWIAALAATTTVAMGCASSRSSTGAAEPSGQCRNDTEGDVEMAAKTGVQGAKTGVLTAGSAIKQAGSSAAGLVEGSSSEAETRWNEGKRETKRTARDGAAETKRSASTRRCADR